MRFVSWNVNGLRACMKKGFSDFLYEIDADFFCIQETKMKEEQKTFTFEGYHEFWNSAIRPGYSGTLIYTKHEPMNVTTGLPDGTYNDEGRIITLEYDNFYLINTYVPNSKRELLRLDYRMEYEDAVRKYYNDLSKTKPVILTGDLNVAHQEIDLKNPKTNRRNAGFTDEERGKLTDLLNSGFTDSFRYLYPDKIKYSWWSYRAGARQKNVGWRLDYFIVSNNIKENIIESDIYNEILGSDHCPVLLDITL